MSKLSQKYITKDQKYICKKDGKPYLRSWYLTLEKEDEVVGCDLVVLNPLEEPPVVILHEPPVQHDLELTTGGTGAPQRLTRDQGQSAVRILDVAHRG